MLLAKCGQPIIPIKISLEYASDTESAKNIYDEARSQQQEQARSIKWR